MHLAKHRLKNRAVSALTLGFLLSSAATVSSMIDSRLICNTEKLNVAKINTEIQRYHLIFGDIKVVR